jgi:phage tail sheath protein FI
MTNYTYPGIYIEEQQATGPIQGVGTSIAAFIGPTSSGPIGVPTLITNWTQFKTNFGNYPTVSNAFYTHYAVRGFFDNGGTIAYIIRVSASTRAFLNLSDRLAGANPPTALVVRAKQEGRAGNSIQVTVQDAPIVPTTQNPPPTVIRARAPITSANDTAVTLQNASDAAQFRTGDFITIDPATGSSKESAQIIQIQGNQLTLSSRLTTSYDNTAFVRIADLTGNQPFRIQNYQGIETGSAIQLTQGTTQETHVVDSLLNDFVTLAGKGLTATFQMGSNASPITLSTFEFTLVVSLSTAQTPIIETFSNLAMDPRHSRYFGNIVQSTLVDVLLPDVPDVQPPPTNLPAVIKAANLTKGLDENPKAIGSSQYSDALTLLERVADVNLVCVPAQFDATTQQAVHKAVVEHCRMMADRFAILDAAQGSPIANPAQGSMATNPPSPPVITQVVAAASDTGYAAFYYPWISISNPNDTTGRSTLLVPPSGHIAGIYARSDSQRGVHKAPANEFINGALDLELPLNDTDQGLLNLKGINALRLFPGQPPIVWGARTTSSNTAWQYINVRRLFIFVEQSLIRGLRWAVFEPNDTTLWKKLERTISEFLTRVWVSGALFGTKASEAFYVKIDEELNTPDTRALGQVIIEVGIAPVRPAEFVIVRIAMWDGGTQTSVG